VTAELGTREQGLTSRNRGEKVKRVDGRIHVESLGPPCLREKTGEMAALVFRHEGVHVFERKCSNKCRRYQEREERGGHAETRLEGTRGVKRGKEGLV